MTINNVSNQFSVLDVCLTMFHNLIFAPDGKIYFDPTFEAAADWSLCYFNGNIYIHRDNHLYCLGNLPQKCISLPALTNNTAINSIEDTGFFLHSKEHVLDPNLDAFAAFRIKDVLVLYIADASISSAIYCTVENYTPTDEAFYCETFYHLVGRHNPRLAKKAAVWLAKHIGQREEV